MKITKLVIMSGVIGGLMLFTESCKKETTDTPAPTIENVEIGKNNSGMVVQDEYLPIKASIQCQESIKTVVVEIIPKLSDWSYYKAFDEFEGLTNLDLSDSILIPISADSGRYTFKLTVTDVKNGIIDKDAALYIATLPKINFDKITGFCISPDGIKFVASNIGLLTFNEFTKLYTKVNEPDLYAPLNCLAFAPNNELWLGSTIGAINYNTKLLLNMSASELCNNSITNFSFDLNGRIFIGTPNCLNIMDASNWLVSTGQDDLFLNFEINSLGTSSDGYTYVATNGGGVERFKYDVDGISGATIFNSDWTYLESNTINTVYVFDSIQVYGTPNGAAIHKSYQTKWDWENFAESDGLINNNVISIIRDTKNNLWFGTTAGLSKYDGKTWSNFNKETSTIISDTIKYFSLDTDGSLWFASDLGLSKFSNNTWTNFPK